MSSLHGNSTDHVFLDYALVGVYLGMIMGAVVGAVVMGWKQYMLERIRSPEVDTHFVFLFAIFGLGFGTIAGAFTGLISGLLLAMKSKLGRPKDQALKQKRAEF
jgi:hypothetical protein